MFVEIARQGVVQAKLTDKILDEAFNSLLKKCPDLNASNLKKTRKLMIESVPDCLVENYESLSEPLELPDIKDKHVLAAAIKCSAQVIVTDNLKHFPVSELETYGIEAQSPDTFLLHLIDLNKSKIKSILRELSSEFEDPPYTLTEYLSILENCGLSESVRELKNLN